MIPRLTPPQLRLLASLQPVASNGNCYRYSTAGRQRGSGLVSASALWRRGYVATDEHGNPDARENRDRGLVYLTPVGEQLLADLKASENKS